MTTFASPAIVSAATPAPPQPLELSGHQVRALAAALPAFAEKAPEARLEQYAVHLQPAQDGLQQVIFEPRQDDSAAPTLGGRTAAGPEVNVWIRTSDYGVERASLAR